MDTIRPTLQLSTLIGLVTSLLTGCTSSANQDNDCHVFGQKQPLDPAIFVGVGVDEQRYVALQAANRDLANQLRNDVSSISSITTTVSQQGEDMTFSQHHTTAAHERLVGVKYDWQQCASGSYVVRATKDTRPLSVRNGYLLPGAVWNQTITLLDNRDDGRITAYILPDNQHETLTGDELFELTQHTGQLTLNGKTHTIARHEAPLLVAGKSSQPFASLFSYNNMGQLQSHILDSQQGSLSLEIKALYRPYERKEKKQFLLVQHNTPIRHMFSEPGSVLPVSQMKQEFINLVQLTKQHGWPLATATYTPI